MWEASRTIDMYTTQPEKKLLTSYHTIETFFVNRGLKQTPYQTQLETFLRQPYNWFFTEISVPDLKQFDNLALYAKHLFPFGHIWV